MAEWDPQQQIEQLIYPKLSKTRTQPRGGYTALCPAHQDRTPSLSVYPDPDNTPPRIVVKCHAGCDRDQILAALGLDWRDCYPPIDLDRRDLWTPDGPGTFICAYDYHNRDGQLLFQVVRTLGKNYTGKGFRQRRPDPTHWSGWKWGMTSPDGTTITRVLYRLPQIVEAIQAGQTIALVEGEKDADTLTQIGVPATTTSGGATNLKLTRPEQFEQVLAGARIVAIPDQDEAGTGWAKEIHRRLSPVASVRFYRPLEGKDATDHFRVHGHTTKQLQPYNPLETTPEQEPNLNGHIDDRSVLATDGLEPPDGGQDTPPPGEPPEQAGGLWDADPKLRAIHDFAYSRLVNPQSVLGAAMARISTRIGPHIRLPPVVGSEGTLNLQIGLVGEPGAGKDVAHDLAKELLPDNLNRHIPEIEPATGQGITGSFTAAPPTPNRRAGRRQQDGLPPEPDPVDGGPVQYNDAALFYAGEIDSIAGHAGMRGSILLSYLRKVYTGSAIGGGYAGREQRHPVAQHRYRAAVVIGIQPERAGPLLGPEAEAGGNAQRLVWLWAEPPQDLRSWTHLQGMEPPDIGWQDFENLLPNGQNPDPTQPVRVQPVYHVQVDPAVWAEVREDRLDDRWKGLDRHRNYTRLKVAAVLGIWRSGGRLVLTVDDWELAGQIMRLSDRNRAAVQHKMAQAAAKKTRQKGVAEAHQEEAKERQRLKTTAGLVVRKLRTGGGWLSRYQLKVSVGQQYRGYVEGAVEQLEREGVISVMRETNPQGIETLKCRYDDEA